MKKMLIILIVCGMAMALDLTSDMAPGAGSAITSVYNPIIPPSNSDVITWTTLTPSTAPARYWCPGSGVYRDTIWFCGGRGSTATSLNDIVAYVPATNTWITTGLPTLISTRRAGGGGRIGNKIYVAGGRDVSSVTLSSCEEFNLDTKVVTTKASMPTARWACVGAIAGDKLYIVGKEATSDGACYEYDPVTNQWTTKASCPVGRGWAAAAGAGGKLYVFGGFSASSVVLSDCYEFDPVANTWTLKAPMPTGLVYSTAVAISDQEIYLVGGSIDNTNPSNVVYKYNVATNSWATETPMPTARGWAMANYWGGSIYATFGCNNFSAATCMTTNERGSVAPPPANDVGMDAILSPGGAHTVGTPLTPRGRVKNFGTAAQSNFQVTCSIVGASTYTNTQTVTGPLASGDTARVTFATYTPTTSENVTVIMKTLLVNDTNPLNNRLTRTTIIGQIYFNDLEANNGNYVPDPATSAWEWGTPTSGPMAAYSGVKLWGTYLAGNYINSANWKLTSCPYTASVNNPTFQYMHWYAIESYYDGYNVKISTDGGTTWTIVDPTVPYPEDAAYTGNAGIPGERCYSGTTTGNSWNPAIFNLTLNAGQQFMMRLHFGSDPSVIYAGAYVDDIMLIGATPSGIMEQAPNNLVITTLNNMKPNPVTNGVANISFSIAAPTNALLRIYDASGRLITTLVNSNLDRGTYNYTWNGTDNNNREVAEGIYFYTLETDKANYTKKMVFTR